MRKAHHPAIKAVNFTPTGQTATDLALIRARKKVATEVQYTVDGRATSKQFALAAWLARDPDGERSHVIFDKAHETSTTGYVAREYLEQEGITLRHPFEEQAQ